MSNIESVVESVDVIIDAYVASWNETDPAKRKSALAASCVADARYRDPVMVSDGQAGLDAMLAGVQAKFPGFVLRRISALYRARRSSRVSISRRCRLTASSRTSWASSTRCLADDASSSRSPSREAHHRTLRTARLSLAGLSRMAISVVSTGARSAKRRDLLSAISGLSWREGLSTRPFGPWSRRRQAHMR